MLLFADAYKIWHFDQINPELEHPLYEINVFCTKKLKRKNASLLNVNYVQACENGYYGIECNSTCGQCSFQNDCFHENGTCFNGCELGYSGDLCQNGKVNTKHWTSFKRHIFTLIDPTSD